VKGWTKYIRKEIYIMHKLLTLVLAVAVIASLVIVGCAKPAPPEEPIKLGWVAFLPESHDNVKDIQHAFVDKVNEQANGRLVIEWRGGPEVFAPNDIGTAVQSGVVDIGFTCFGFYESIVPGVNAAMLTQITLDEERKPGGAYDYMLGLHKEHGLFYLGRPDRSGPSMFYSVYLHNKIEKPEDFAKLKLGSSTAGRPAILGWGAAQVMLGPPDFYSAMERHVVDGIAGMPVTSWYDFGGAEITKYVIDQPFYDSASSLIMNLDRLNALPKDLQDLVIDTFVQAEKELQVKTLADLANSKQLMIDEGVEYYKLSPEVNDWYITSAYDKGWEFQQESFPEVTPRLKELYAK